jgi:formate hydrogenlyase subunit 3/multisubunit Na+/H+ antiporter MnhD subunit
MNKTAAPKVTDINASAFSASMVISGVRCALAYVILPFLAPLIGISAGAGPWIGLPLGLVAILANVLSIRRFWKSDHRWKWPMSLINAAVIGLLTVLITSDLLNVIS